MLMDILNFLRWQDLFDIALVAYIIYKTLSLLAGTRAIQLVKGLLVLAVLWAFAKWLNLDTFSWILSRTFSALLIIIPIIFQPELRRILEELGRSSMWRHTKVMKKAEELADEMCSGLMYCCAHKIGALIVLQRETGLKDYWRNAVLLNADITNELLIAIFWPNNPLHDGALIIDGEKILDHVSFTVGHDDKIAFVGANERAKTVLFQILAGEMEPDEGDYKWGVTTSQSYFPKDNTKIFDTDLAIADWLTQFSENKDASYVRGFLGRMLFPGDAGIKKMRVLSGGEKVRVLLSKMMIEGSNVLIFDEPTDHLDMESITALNNGMMKFPGVILFASRDHQVVQTTANRIIEILPDGGMIDKISTYDDYLEADASARKRQGVTVLQEEDAEDN